MTLTFHALPYETVAAWRNGAPDAYGADVERVISSEAGNPCRSCLEDIEAGEAVLLLANREELLLVSGNGDVLAPDDGVLSAGSGGALAAAAARALLRHADLDARAVCEAALKITAEMDLYTNDQLTVEEI